MKKEGKPNRFSGSALRPAVVKSGDLSDKTVIVLLILVVVVSIISVVVYLQVLQAVSSPETKSVESNANMFGTDESGSLQQKGTVTLQIIEPPASDQRNALPADKGNVVGEQNSVGNSAGEGN